MDTESFEYPPRAVTEIGLETFESQDMNAVTEPGPHAQNLFEKIWFFHYRIDRYAHLINKTFCPGDPTSNKFGQTRFITPAQAKARLEEAFGWKGLPVVLIGHALRNDKNALRTAFGFDDSKAANVIRTIDLQDVAQAHGWRRQIGLKELTEHPTMGVKFKGGHSAGNDGAYTLFNIIRIVLEPELSKISSTGKTAQQVVDYIAQYSAHQEEDMTGVAKRCTRCNSTNHLRGDCYAFVRCSICYAAGRGHHAKRHVDSRCTWNN